MRRLSGGISWLKETVSDPEKLSIFLVALPRRLRIVLRLAFAFFVVATVIFLGLVEFIGERNILTAFFLFAPQQIWFVPLGMFLVASFCLLDWRLGFAVLGTTFAFTFFYLDWEMSGAKSGRGGEELTVMTFNRGQRSGSLQPFKKRHNPDIIAMQDAGGKSSSYVGANGYEDVLYAEDVGEYLLLSKHPILDKGLVEFDIDGKGHAIAAWFTVDFADEEIVVYNVHLDTPRDQLKALRRGAFLRGLFPTSASAKSYQRFWDLQITLAAKLRAQIEAEKRPVIVVGDFNSPDHGHIYRTFAGSFQDAHEEAGHGFGWTFPGTTRNPLTLFGPWLRIDHQFASRAWRVLGSEAESGRPSQHLAVAARYELVK